MIKIGLGSIYFAARNAGSAGSPATLTITFGDGIVADDTFYLIINSVQYSISFGMADAASVPIYRDNEGNLEIYYADYIATAFSSYITSTFSSSLTVTQPTANAVTLTTKATGPTANLNAACVLPIFPNVPLTGLSEISKFDFAGLSASDLARSGSLPAKYLTIGDASGNNHYFWWKSSTESDPSPVGIGHRIDYSLGDETYQLAQALITAAQATTLWVGSLDEEAATLTTVAGGNVINASAGTTPVVVTTVKQGISTINITLRKTSGFASGYPDNYKLYSGETLLYNSDWDYSTDLVWSNVTASNANTLTVVITASEVESNSPVITALTNNTCGAAINKSLPFQVTEPFNLTSFTSNGNVQINFTTNYSP
jgi:hypothetical protein